MTQRYAPARAIVATELHQVGGRPPLREYLRELVERRHFIAMQSWSSATHQHRGMLLGNLWMILAPVLDGLMYFLIFGIVLQASQGIPNYPGYLIVGILMFSFTSRSLTSSAASIQTGRSLVQAFTFPRAALPLATVLRETISSVPVVVAVVVLALVISGPGVLSPYWTILPLIFLLQAWLNLGLSLVVARWGALFPDVRQLLNYAVRFLMYASAVMFSIERFDSLPGLRPVMEANPLYTLLTMYREVLLYETFPSAGQWAHVTGWALVTSVVGMIYFWQAEVRYGRRT